MKRFHTITVKPEIPANIQHLGAFADGDLLFDWTAFNVPKGANKLINVTALIRGTDGAAQTFAMNLYFAKTFQGSAPGTLGTLHATANGTGYQNNLIGAWPIEEVDISPNTGLDLMSLNSGLSNTTSSQATTPIVLQGEPDSGLNVGYDKLYVAAITPDGDANFSTAVETTGALDVSETLTHNVASLDDGSGGSALCKNKFAVGDIIHAEDNIILGEIKTVDTAELTFKVDGTTQYHGNGEVLYTNPSSATAWQTINGAGTAGDLADGDELYNIHPITLILSFEQ